MEFGGIIVVGSLSRNTSARYPPAISSFSQSSSSEVDGFFFRRLQRRACGFRRRSRVGLAHQILFDAG